jgi:hypothetical protein
MSIHEDGTYDEEAARRSRRRKQAVVGVAGVAAVLGGGAFFVTQAMTAKQAIAPEVASAPLAPQDPASDSPSTAPAVAPSSAKPRGPAGSRHSASPAPSPSRTKTAAERIAEARAAAAKAGYPIERPLVTQGGGPVTVTNTGSLQSGGTMRVISARYDVTGQREMLWAADDGRAAGNARCTQNFHFSNNKTARVRPTMLMCWRTSAAKSVVTIAVVPKGRPSSAASVAAIDAQWAKLG